jgi:branched-chain amino acid transport system permease protein
MGNFVQILSYGLAVGSVLALVALGYSLVFSTTRVVNFAQGSMLVVAGYLTFALVRAGLNIWLAFLGAVVLSAIVGIVIEFVAIRPLGKFDPETNVSWIFTTFSVSLIAFDLIKLTIGAEPRAIPELVHSIFGWRGSHPYSVSIAPNDILIIGSAMALMLVLEFFQQRTMMGRAIRAVAQDKQTASLMGINVNFVVVLTFAMAGALAAIGAVLLAPRLAVKFDNGALLGIYAFVAAVLGGLGSTRGAIIGGYAIALVGAVIRVASPSGSRYELLAVFALFLVVLVLRPQGILGSPVIEKV